MEDPYDILKADFCIYCQRSFEKPENLQRHILAKHQKTYAYYSVIRALNKRKGRG